MSVLPIHVTIWGNERGLFKVSLEEASTFGWTEHGKKFPDTALWLKAYSENKKWPLPPMDLAHLSHFTLDVLEVLRQILPGRTLSYAAIASRMGRNHAARAVGRACGANPIPLFFPCHRVILSDGTLGGYAFGIGVKKLLLEHEGVK